MDGFSPVVEDVTADDEALIQLEFHNFILGMWY